MRIIKNAGKKLLTWDMKPEAWIEYGYYQAGGWFLIVRLPMYKFWPNWSFSIKRQKALIFRTYGKVNDCSGFYVGTAWISPDGLECEG